MPPFARHRPTALACQECDIEIAKQRVHTALAYKPPTAHQFCFVPGQAVYVYREKGKS